jgi:hypothetical protein
MTTGTREPPLRWMVRRAAGWHAQRAACEGLRDLADLILR